VEAAAQAVRGDHGHPDKIQEWPTGRPFPAGRSSADRITFIAPRNAAESIS
jgi:hypothetical protein